MFVLLLGEGELCEVYFQLFFASEVCIVVWVCKVVRGGQVEGISPMKLGAVFDSKRPVAGRK